MYGLLGPYGPNLSILQRRCHCGTHIINTPKMKESLYKYSDTQLIQGVLSKSYQRGLFIEKLKARDYEVYPNITHMLKIKAFFRGRVLPH